MTISENIRLVSFFVFHRTDVCNTMKIIAIEGVDQIGKSTLCRNLQNVFYTKKIKTNYVHFPLIHKSDTDCFNDSGSPLLLNDNAEKISHFLNKTKQFDRKEIYMLFHSNRIFYSEEIVKRCISNDTKILLFDRFTYSGIAYGIANGLDKAFCTNIEMKNKLKPDLIVYLRPENFNDFMSNFKCNDYYERIDFQYEILKNFDDLFCGNNDIVSTVPVKIFNVNVKDRENENTHTYNEIINDICDWYSKNVHI